MATLISHYRSRVYSVLSINLLQANTDKCSFRAWHYLVHTCGRKCFGAPTALPSS